MNRNLSNTSEPAALHKTRIARAVRDAARIDKGGFAIAYESA